MFISTTTTLSLPNLRILDIVDFSLISNITMNTPKLKHLYISELKIDALLALFDSIEEKKRCMQNRLFINLICLYSINIDSFNFLSIMHNLRSIYVYKQRVLKRLLAYRERSKRADLQIYCNDILVESNQFNKNDFSNFISNYMTKYHLTTNKVPRFECLNYTELMKVIKKEAISIPSDFHEKFFNIQVIELDDIVEDEEHFIEFVGKCKNVIHIRIRNSNNESLGNKVFNMCTSLIYKKFSSTSETFLNLK
jgi:hypothetical protein